MRDPRLFIEDYQGDSGKLEQVKDLLVAAKENKRRVLLFSQFTGMLTILQEELAELGLLNILFERQYKTARSINDGRCI